MDTLNMLVGVLIGAALGLGAAAIWMRNRNRLEAKLTAQTQVQKSEELAGVVSELKIAFASLSRDALSSNTDDFLKLAKTRLDQETVSGEKVLEGKKKLIDARLEEMGTKLTTLNTLIQSVEKQRAESHGMLKGQLERATQATNRLHDTTAQLREALANPQRRGQWGERMAEDVLRLAGFVEGVNYAKQQVLSDGGKPDFSFFMPGKLCVHMDVKFPLANYMRMLETDDETVIVTRRTQFLKDVRSRLKEVTTRDYIDPAGGTVDYVLLFIPNEQIYGFIHEHDPTLLDDAMRSKVVLCSPLTLYAILAVIRQAIDNFRLDQASAQILQLLADFKKQWSKYVESMDKMGRRLEDASKEFQHLSGTRTRQLERELDKIDALREQRVDDRQVGTRDADTPILPPPE